MEFILAQPTGQTELLEGAMVLGEDGSLTADIGPSSVNNSASAKQVDSTRRTYTVDAARRTMDTRFDMGAVGKPLQQHLESTLHKQAQ